jgi:hypothetical protein
MRDPDDIRKLVKEFCEAQRAWERETGYGGFPLAATRRNLYYAGRALFKHVSVQYPETGMYADNSPLEAGTEVHRSKR